MKPEELAELMKELNEKTQVNMFFLVQLITDALDDIISGRFPFNDSTEVDNIRLHILTNGKDNVVDAGFLPTVDRVSLQNYIRDVNCKDILIEWLPSVETKDDNWKGYYE